ncbi:MAG: hypothetical protein A2667_03355 [Candidatus Wildermuthbacteria bacterium RIFCSPHIGHO2_01_FULL_47_27]|uniref:Flippase-like domain-containing protein n=1 Tax=Candidatus Wildermuthbacteria bacterium RIFCSPHIGHO2_02_FULL_47_17 TaxID=1802452 RepID=A0A1G2R2P9_9BACT|nr:MAG: hypothetical protein UY15_C0009G0008 [Parcubacteria group bacterium GW2011_GWA2_47_9]OHA65029.1 MAG: hypothetical protein A2667_03355 [Candidatus Wildermuthbacteria bacterium RIFCSPHIGHO2_01_FULL_47_27]OHA67053.1 MAG: hypothetical protein A3D59_02280 [Candidatus Wildermuthbacteria bacterium RIFCSPHIGHO2_02_FULL_47_17]
MRLSKGIFVKIALLVTLILLASLFATLDFKKIYGILGQANFFWLFAALNTLFLELILKALRLKALIAPHGKSSLKDNLIITLIGLPFGTVTPGRVGDFAKIYALSRKTSLSIAKGLAIGILEKLLDFISLLIFAAAGIAALFFSRRLNFDFSYSIFLSFFLLAFLVLFFNKKFLKKTLNLVYGKFVPSKQKARLQNGFEEFSAVMSAAFREKTSLAISFGVAFLLWLNRLLRIYFLALSIGITAEFIYFILLIPIIELVEILPISIMGFGTREYAYLLLFSIAGVSKESAVALSLLTFIATAIPFSVFGYVAALKEHSLNNTENGNTENSSLC